MNYIGSKFSLLSEIERVLDIGNVPASGIALDLFAGTGIVSQLLKKRGHIAYSNDWQYYSYVTCVAYIELNEAPDFSILLRDKHWGSRITECPLLPSKLVNYTKTGKQILLESPAAHVLSYLNQIPGKEGLFFHTYCEGGDFGRLYFSNENGLRIQAIRDQIEIWYRKQLISLKEHAWLIASLIEGTDRAANTASVYGAYLKHVKRSAQKALQIYFPVSVDSVHNEGQHRAFCQDGEHLLQELSDTRLKLVYIDPPYNARQYNANYHILETIARWDLEQITPKGKTGLRSSAEKRSLYCSKVKVFSAFKRLISLINADYVLFSYNNEGLVSKEELEAIFGEFCNNVLFEEIPYRRFRADSDSESRVYKGDSTTEYLILGEMNRSAVMPRELSSVVGSFDR